jgi:D-psicose/D-tagatose/L-ribulose 3-epimerase
VKLSLCNEVLLPLGFKEQCAYAKACGYDGLEIAPFTLGDDPRSISGGRARQFRNVAEDHGIEITSLHWLAMAPEGLSITALDATTQQKTRDVLLRVIDLAAELGATMLVHGSPAQRRLDIDPDRQRAVAISHFAALGERAGANGLTYCIEAINANECNFINRLDQARAIIGQTGAPALKLMLDVSHAAQEEDEPLAGLAEKYWRSGDLVHIQLNAINRQAPGQGNDAQGRDDIAPLLRRLGEIGYTGALAIEPFVYVPDGPGCAAFAAGYVKGLLAGSKRVHNPTLGN